MTGDWKQLMSLEKRQNIGVEGTDEELWQKTLHTTGIQSEGRNGKLNPAWVAWLQGFPEDWTVISGEKASKLWETRSSRKSRKLSENK
jgi:hypothetical protein